MRSLLFLMFVSIFFLVGCDNSPAGPSNSSSLPQGNSSFNTVFSSSSSLMGLLSSSSVTTLLSSSSTGTVEVSSSSSIVTLSSSSKTASVFYAALPRNPDAAGALSLFNQFKTLFYEPYESVEHDPLMVQLYPQGIAATARVRVDDSTYTYSEAIGYGMLAAFFAGDYEMVNRLFLYNKIFQMDDTGLMKWKVKGFYFGSDGSATDAEVDVITALILMYEHTGDQMYLNEALIIAEGVWNYEMLSDSYYLIPGNSGWLDKAVLNLSYFSPVCFRLLAQYDPRHDWNAVLEANYTLMMTVNTAGNGMFPDWIGYNGVPKHPDNNSTNANKYDKFALESVRIPWRLAWDFAWFGDNRAQTMLNRMAAFIMSSKGGISDARGYYAYLAGDNSDPYPGKEAMKGAACATAMAAWPAAQDSLDACVPVLMNAPMRQPSKKDYFNPILQVIYAELLNGLIVRP